jgi:hypothetical protein
MPRAGTTLIEQILASHPSVVALGETGAFAPAVAATIGPDAMTPEFAVGITPGSARRLGETYIHAIGAGADPAMRFADKTTENFVWAGMIHCALPKARMIHVRRDPIDTCFSCFSKLFRAEYRYSYDFAELGRYYRAYEQLMAHWRRVLPEQAMLDVQYADVVSDFESTVRHVLAYCNLPWDDACRNFHATRRAVSTHSDAQVRRPLYTSAVGRARPYAEFLGPLRDALGR